jgi:hypothetical protein
MGFIASGTSISRRRHLVALFVPGTLEPDGDGGYVESPMVPLNPATWSAAIETATPGTETLGVVVQTSITHVIAGDWRPDITTATRIVFKGRAFDVRSVFDVQEARRELRCLVEEHATAAASGASAEGASDGRTQPSGVRRGGIARGVEAVARGGDV